MKNYTKLIVALVAITAMSAKIYGWGYNHIIKNYTEDTVNAQWLGVGASHPVQILPPHGDGWEQSFGSGLGCTHGYKVWGPLGEAEIEVGFWNQCTSTNHSIYYTYGFLGQSREKVPIGYKIIDTPPGR